MKYLKLAMTCILFLAICPPADAHAFLDHASPRVGSSGPPPDHIELWMTEELEPAFSRVQVFDSQMHQVDRRDVKISGATMIVSLPKLSAGTYLVQWKAVATDTHHTGGTFNFTVR